MNRFWFFKQYFKHVQFTSLNTSFPVAYASDVSYIDRGEMLEF